MASGRDILWEIMDSRGVMFTIDISLIGFRGS